MGQSALGGREEGPTLRELSSFALLPHENARRKTPAIGIELCCHFGKTERITHVIGHILHFGRCVVMRETNRIPLLLELSYLRYERPLVHVASFRIPERQGYMPLSAHLRLRNLSGRASFAPPSIRSMLCILLSDKTDDKTSILEKAHRRNGTTNRHASRSNSSLTPSNKARNASSKRLSFGRMNEIS